MRKRLAPQPDDAKAAARRCRRAADTARWRSRRRRAVELFSLEAGAQEFDLAIKYSGLREHEIGNKVAVNAALGRLLRRALAALLRESRRPEKV
jgi:hypothetical protein